MNILSMVMGLLLIFACTFTLSLRKATVTQGVEKTYQAHLKASRKIQNSYESLCYRRMRGVKPKNPEGQATETPKKETRIEPLNLDCARLNLWPLVMDGAEKHPTLYEMAAQLLRSFYGSAFLNQQPRLEYHMLDAILAAANNEKSNASSVFLEKLALKDFHVKPLYTMQTLYYHMLRGTKKSAGDQSYPALLEYLMVENKKSSICIHHASIEMLSALFGPRAAHAIFHERQESETPLTVERVQDLCSQNGKIGLSDEFFELFDWQASRHHSSGHKTLVHEEADVCLKQKVFFSS
ncbi:MAG: hypothetical protein HW387_1550 [Parachlamydiales bacterium]|nr:hypothetical protein [Parachlamydiales bacterium]